MSQGVSRFRTSFTFVEGDVPALMVEGKIVGLNMVNWTVNVESSFDRKRYFDIQVGSPYQHFSNGEGIYIVPEMNAKCVVCIPSDSSPPFVAAFIMPFENVDMATAETPKGTTSHSSPNRTSSGASFAGGRPRAKPGDIIMRGRDGNFVILHRGGVLQIGANELSQRLFIPLNNFIMDICDNYTMHAAGGSVSWGMQASPTSDKYPTSKFETFRVYANDKYADVRISQGNIPDPVKGTLDSKADLQKNVNFEIAIAPQGFDPETGAVIDAKVLTFRLAVDGQGNVLFGGSGKLSVYFKKAISIFTSEDFDVECKTLSMKATGSAVINGGALVHLKGGVVKLGPGSKPVAHQGSLVQITLPFTPMPVPGSPPLVLSGIVLTGEPTVLT